MYDHTENPLDKVVQHVLNTRYEDLPAVTVENVKTFLLDTIGVAMAGTAGAGIEDLISVAETWGDSEESSVWFSGEKLTAHSAALVNAYQIHCMEFDCVHEGAVLHPMATIMGALMAWIEREGCRGNSVSGKELITALALGVDVSTMLGVVTDSPLEFFRPATAGGFGAVVSIAKIAGFDELTLRNALGAQYSQTSGTLQAHVEGSPMLGMQVGFNSRAAVSATDLARAGFRGPHDILTGQYGYFRLFENNSYNLEPFLARLGIDWQIDALSHKPFPSGRLTHNYAKLCLRFVAGVYLKHGWVDIPHFLGSELVDADVLAAAAKVSVVQDNNPDLNGDPAKPLSSEENIDKFTRCCSRSKKPFTEKQQDDIITFCETLESQNDVASLIPAMSLGTS